MCVCCPQPYVDQFIVCLFILFIYPHPESDTISQEKDSFFKKDKTTVWIKWPTTQGRATRV